MLAYSCSAALCDACNDACTAHLQTVVTAAALYQMCSVLHTASTLRVVNAPPHQASAQRVVYDNYWQRDTYL
eukprot:4122-Heterococcus_DN1.PRE.1